MPSLDKSYDFKLDEDIVLSVITDEIASIICQKEQCGISGNKRELMLFKPANSHILSMGLSLYENGIKTGDRLVLV